MILHFDFSIMRCDNKVHHLLKSYNLVAILPLAIVHTMGNLFTNMNLGKVVVSFTHTFKAMKPFFLILLSAMFLGEKSMDNITLFSVRTIMSQVYPHLPASCCPLPFVKPFSCAEIKKATGGFNGIITAHSDGSAYKALFQGSLVVVVKELRIFNEVKDAFNEEVQLLMRLHHQLL
ncbi:hypothetical protein GIB67_018550 [Kingdonia uniflora]|uniref:Sugar phosphate transporter domain-containing protein n=1 Tax=Kingdonia uniflora TaxID=39325 RepID=A0A7J7LWC6_9MAGN|nr:hypothetical protein GIB67_018550 [Kingdonia uniflora]